MLRQVRHQQQLLARVRRLLPEKQAAHLRDACLNGPVLNLYADSPVWANRLRFTTPALLSEIRTLFPGIASIRVRTAPPLVLQRKTRTTKIPDQSGASIESVTLCARDMDDNPLRAALLRLAGTLRKFNS